MDPNVCIDPNVVVAIIVSREDVQVAVEVKVVGDCLDGPVEGKECGHFEVHSTAVKQDSKTVIRAKGRHPEFHVVAVDKQKILPSVSVEICHCKGIETESREPG